MVKKYYLAIREKGKNTVTVHASKHDRAMALDSRGRKKGKFDYAMSMGD